MVPDPTFADLFRDGLPLEWCLIDPLKKVHVVHADSCYYKTKLTWGWKDMVEFYGLKGMYIYHFTYIDGPNFKIRTTNTSKVEILYVEASPRVMRGVHLFGVNIMDNFPREIVCHFSTIISQVRDIPRQMVL